jgi:hypothetical protein
MSITKIPFSEILIPCEPPHTLRSLRGDRYRRRWGIWRKRPEVAVSAPAFLDGGDIYGFALIAYFVLLLGCAIRFAVKIGAFSVRRRRQQRPDEALSDSSLL